MLRFARLGAAEFLGIEEGEISVVSCAAEQSEDVREAALARAFIADDGDKIVVEMQFDAVEREFLDVRGRFFS